MRYYLLCYTLFFSMLAKADSIADLKQFIERSQSFCATFTQKVSDLNLNNKISQVSTGVVYIQRPGKFYWRYDKPYPNQIIGDGQKIWLYDPELKQVIVKKMDEAFDSSPAALLAGDNAFQKNYHVKNLPKSDSIVWLVATPKSAAHTHTFKQIRMGFLDKVISILELVDQFGQTTTIFFEKVKLNPPIKADQFIFIPPNDVEVLKDDRK